MAPAALVASTARSVGTEVGEGGVVRVRIDAGGRERGAGAASVSSRDHRVVLREVGASEVSASTVAEPPARIRAAMGSGTGWVAAGDERVTAGPQPGSG